MVRALGRIGADGHYETELNRRSRSGCVLACLSTVLTYPYTVREATRAAVLSATARLRSRGFDVPVGERS